MSKRQEVCVEEGRAAELTQAPLQSSEVICESQTIVH